MVFAISCKENFTLIGATEEEVRSVPRALSILNEDFDYLCEMVNWYVRLPNSLGEMVWFCTGARALFDDDSRKLSTVSGDYDLGLSSHCPPFLVFGGKITTTESWPSRPPINWVASSGRSAHGGPLCESS